MFRGQRVSEGRETENFVRARPIRAYRESRPTTIAEEDVYYIFIFFFLGYRSFVTRTIVAVQVYPWYNIFHALTTWMWCVYVFHRKKCSKTTPHYYWNRVIVISAYYGSINNFRRSTNIHALYTTIYYILGVSVVVMPAILQEAFRHRTEPKPLFLNKYWLCKNPKQYYYIIITPGERWWESYANFVNNANAPIINTILLLLLSSSAAFSINIITGNTHRM